MRRPARKHVLLAAGIGLGLLLASPRSEAAGNGWEADARIDRRLGILDEPFRVDLARIRTFGELTRRVPVGLPPYAQQPGGAQILPQTPQQQQQQP